MNTIQIDPLNKTQLKIIKRLSIPDKHNLFWDRDFELKTGQKPGAGQSRNHRISDNDIQRITVHCVNQNDPEKLDQLILHAFPWENEDDKEVAVKLRMVLFKPNKTLAEKAEIASELAQFMAQYRNNISKGNGSRNSGIGKHLDLNAPKNSNNRHSLTPKSKRIAKAEEAHDIGFSPPRMDKKTKKVMSSQYALGGKANKTVSDIVLDNCTPETERLMKRLSF